MARTAKTVTALASDAGADSGAAGVYTTIDAALVTAGLTVTAAGTRPGLVLHVKNTHASAHNVIVRAGTRDGVPGDAELTVAVPATSERMIVLGDTVQYAQDDQSYLVDFSTGFTGSIAVLRTP